MSAKIYIEGGGVDSKELHARLRENFSKLLDSCGFGGRKPRLVACGGRNSTFDDFKTAHGHSAAGDYVAMLVDSEDPVADIEQTWAHLSNRDRWQRPDGADGQQVLLMTTCMETWIIADRPALRKQYGNNLRENARPTLHNLESRPRDAVYDALVDATRDCKNAYRKGARSFEVVGVLTSIELRQHLPSFVRFERVLNARL